MRAKLVAGTLFVVAVIVGMDVMFSTVDSDRAAADAHADTASMQLAAAAKRTHASEARFDTLNAVADRQAAIAFGAKRALAGYVQAMATAVKADTPSTGDTTAMVSLTHPARPGQSWRIPQFLVEDVRQMLREAQQLAQAYEASERARLFAVDTLIPDYKRQLIAADNVIASLRRSIDVRDRERARRRWRDRFGVFGGVDAELKPRLLAGVRLFPF